MLVSKQVTELVTALVLEEIEGSQMDPLDPLTRELRRFIYDLREEAKKPQAKPQTPVKSLAPMPTPKPAPYVKPKQTYKPQKQKPYAKKKRWERGPLSGKDEVTPWKGENHFPEPQGQVKHITDGLLAVLELNDPREDL